MKENYRSKSEYESKSKRVFHLKLEVSRKRKKFYVFFSENTHGEANSLKFTNIKPGNTLKNHGFI